MAGAYSKNGPSKTNYEATGLETYGNWTSKKTKTVMARGRHGRFNNLKVKNWEE
jgi:hypothetical protein